MAILDMKIKISQVHESPLQNHLPENTHSGDFIGEDFIELKVHSNLKSFLLLRFGTR